MLSPGPPTEAPLNESLGQPDTRPSVSLAHLGVDQAVGTRLQDSGPSHRHNGLPGASQEVVSPSVSVQECAWEEASLLTPPTVAATTPSLPPTPARPCVPSLRSRRKQSIQPTLSKALRALLGEDLRGDDRHGPSKVHGSDCHVNAAALPGWLREQGCPEKGKVSSCSVGIREGSLRSR